ncbi:DnaD domain-containing protein [Ectobacillus ponti]|uniref:DnaD domain-containing protein n=1 Tax=Ectobacillus ponti TaxID=2961894 RepID=A0AA42BPI5_9BACI|nr:DnaD domain-containing protein [Ectobacillus ponti]MCP8968787.1 DnaD domain-containing protein [Ectobacillus ponti]
MKKKAMIQWFEQGSIAIPKLLMMQYRKLGLNELEFMIILHIHTFLECGNAFPTPNEIAGRMTITPAQAMEVIRSLMQRGFVTIEGNRKQEALMSEVYSLQPLWEKMLQLLMQENMEQEQERTEQAHISLYSMFEKEFGRPLSPFECETLAMWQDQDEHDASLIQSALREAVMSGKLNFRYIDRILFEWKKNGIQTVEEAQNHSRKFRAHQTRPQPKKEPKYTGKVPFYNWLEQ